MITPGQRNFSIVAVFGTVLRIVLSPPCWFTVGDGGGGGGGKRSRHISKVPPSTWYPKCERGEEARQGGTCRKAEAAPENRESRIV